MLDLGEFEGYVLSAGLAGSKEVMLYARPLWGRGGLYPNVPTARVHLNRVLALYDAPESLALKEAARRYWEAWRAWLGEYEPAVTPDKMVEIEEDEDILKSASKAMYIDYMCSVFKNGLK